MRGHRPRDGFQSGRFQEGSEQAVNFPVDKRLPFLRNEDVVATPADLLTTGQVVAEARHCSLVQRH